MSFERVKQNKKKIETLSKPLKFVRKSHFKQLNLFQFLQYLQFNKVENHPKPAKLVK